MSVSDALWAPALSDPAGLRAAGLFLAEGRLVIERVLAGAAGGAGAIVAVLSTPPAAEALDLAGLVGDRLTIRAAAEMAALTGFNFHRGVLALVRRPPVLSVDTVIRGLAVRSSEPTSAAPVERKSPRAAPSATVSSGAPLPRVLVVAEHLVDVDNVGSCFRNAHAFGVAGVLLDDRCPDPLYRKAVRTSLGTVLDVPWVQAPIGHVMAALTAAGVATVGLAPHRGAVTIAAVAAELAAHGPAALVIGNEGHGLSAGTLERCDRVARIPMAGDADSLNVATALALALYVWRIGRG